MRIDDAQIRVLASAVSDGTGANWSDAEAAAASDDQREVVRQLRVLAQLTAVHRAVDPATSATVLASQSHRPVADDLAPHSTWGPLEVLERVGHGSFGAVYRAWDPRLEREVALKLLEPPDEGHTDPSLVIDEGRLLARVKHPNVIAVYGADQVEGRVGLWMEFVEGQTLQQWVAERGPLGPREAAMIGMDLCRALAAVHGAGLLHRDVKAQNVMREAGGRIVLMDFGAGLDRLGRSVQLAAAGTPIYMAPELLADAAPSAASDIYALGVLLFHLVSCEFPLVAATLEDLLQGHAAGASRRLRDVRPDLPAAFVQVVDRAIAADPADRFRSAGELEAALAASLDLAARWSREPAPPAHARRILVLASILFGLLLALAAGGVLMWRGRPGSAGEAPVRPVQALAVLPLDDLSASGDRTFGEAVTALLTGELAKLSGLRVISHTSAAAYRGEGKPAKAIARELGVDAIVEGSVSRDGDRVRVVAQLISGATDSLIWTQTYEHDVRDAFTLQGTIARDIAASIDLRLTPQEQQRLAARRAVSPAAQQAYLRGWSSIERGPGSADALAAFEEAIAADPEYALAHAGLAWAAILNSPLAGAPDAASYTRARAAATRALALDPASAMAHWVLGQVRFYFDWDWRGAETAFTRAVDLVPNDANAHQYYGWFLAGKGDLEGARREMTRAREIDPLLYTRRSALAAVLYYSRRFDEAEAELRAALDVAGGYRAAHMGLARIRAEQRRYDEAIAILERPEMTGDPRAAMELARIRAVSGHPAAARAALAGLDARARNEAGVYAEALARFALGERDRGFALLDRALEQRAFGLLWLSVDPRVDMVRRDPRLAALLDRIGLAVPAR